MSKNQKECHRCGESKSQSRNLQSESKEILLFDDGIQVKGQKDKGSPKSSRKEFRTRALSNQKTSSLQMLYCYKGFEYIAALIG